MRLGGWWRSWITGSVIYGTLIAVYTWNTFPTLGTLEHEAEFITQMSPEAQAVLKVEPRLRPKEQRTGKDKSLMKFEIYGASQPDKDIVALKMPNGHIFEVASHLTREQQNLVGPEYVQVLTKVLSSKRVSAITDAFLIWLVPVVLLCMLGLAMRWVYRGFRP